jgi:hypothetical protein
MENRKKKNSAPIGVVWAAAQVAPLLGKPPCAEFAASNSRASQATGNGSSVLSVTVAQSQEDPLALIFSNQAGCVFVTGGAAQSQDGEWRAVSLSWSLISEYWESEGYANIRRKVEAATMQYFTDDDGPLTLEGPEEGARCGAPLSVPLVAQLTMAAAAVMVARKDIARGQSENIRLFEEMGATALERLDKDETHALIGLFGEIEGVHLVGELGLSMRMGGAKLRPMSLAEIAHPRNPKYPAWREWRADMLVANLVVNGVAEIQLPMTAPELFYVEGTGPACYANHTQHQRYEKTEAMTRTKDMLAAAKKQANQDVLNETLDSHLTRALHFMEAALVMTDISLLKFSMYAGRTFAVYTDMVRDKTFGADSARNLLVRDAAIYDNVVLDWLYALFVLHTRGKIIHMDLHANNFTVLHSVERSKNHAYRVPNPDGEPVLLVTEGDDRDPKAAGAVIDFSRAVVFDAAGTKEALGPEEADEFLSHQVAQLRKGVDYILQALSDTHLTQVTRLRKRAQRLPQFQVTSELGAVFIRAASALDVATLARAALGSIEGCNASKQFVDLMADLEVGALQLFEELLPADTAAVGMVDKPAAPLPDETWPAARLIWRHYAHRQRTTSPPKLETTVYRWDAPIRTDVRDPVAWAALVRDAWKDWGTRPPPAAFATDAAASARAAAAEREVQKIAAAHRRQKATDSSGSWVI